jgi:putative ABC transport system permease protein
VNWWTRLFQRRRLDTRLDAELHDHLERLASDYVRNGMTATEARRRARAEFGGLAQVKERCRDQRGTRWVEDLFQDLRYGLRQLRQNPVFTLVAVSSLALGIGANSAIFALVDGVLLKSLPVRQPDRLVLLDEGSWTNPIWEQIRDRQAALFESAAAWADARFDLSPGGRTELVEGLWASGGFFDTLGVPAIVGRTFTSRDDQRNGGPDGPVAVISYAFWQRRFGGSADAIGRSVTLDRTPFTIVGVTPPTFFGPAVGRSFDVIVPLGTQAIVRGRESWLDARSTWVLEIIARLKPEQTVDAATRALRETQPQVREATLPQGWPAARLDDYLRDGFTLIPAAAGPAGFRTRYERPLQIVMVVVGLVLLIACANIANLLLARASARQHELSMRLALGASRLRIARQLMAESVLLAAIGAAIGLLFAQWGSQLLVRQLSTPRSAVALDLSIDWRILGFTMAVALGTAVLFGIVPALRARRLEPNEALKQHGRSLAGGGSGRLSSPLIVLQVALSLVLVLSAGLFMRTFASLATLDLGFDRDPLLIVEVNASRSAVAPADRLALFERVRSAAAAAPGITAVAMSQITPVRGDGWNGPVTIPGRADVPERSRMTFLNAVTEGWFATYGTTLREGRDFDRRDVDGAPRVAITNEAFVRKYLDGASPIGRHVGLQRGPRDGVMDLEIVGYVENAAYRDVREPVPPVLYMPFAQAHATGAPSTVGLAVRVATESPMLLANTLTDAISRVDGNLALTFRPLAAFVDGALVRERILAMLSGFFGALALLLAGIGLYGMTSYTVNQRSSEIGIRMALGASAPGVAWLVLGRVAALIVVGVGLGAALSLWASRFVATLLYGLEPRDPLTFVGAALVLLAIGALAAWLPARRATRIDPARALREE